MLWGSLLPDIVTQLDGYAAKHNLKALPREELPSVRQTLKDGWIYIFSSPGSYFLIGLKLEAQAPYYASAVMVITAQFKKETIFN